jgi:predicted metal-dependent phosphoesterase TrpH
MAVDLHTHSRVSDGSDSPEQIVEAASERALTAVALTDHDILDGIPAAAARADELGIAFVPGVELSVEWPTGVMHLLAYFVEPGPGPLQDRLGGLRDGRVARNRSILEALGALGVDVSPDEVDAESGYGTAGRPHIAAVLVRKGAATGIADAFDRYLARGRPAYRDRPRLHAAEAVSLTRESGGVAVVAHPHTIADDADGFLAAFEHFAAMGVSGIECHYAEYPPPTRMGMAEIAESLGLVATGGSDYHGSYKPNLRIGTGRGDLAVPDTAYYQLLDARKALADHG